MFENLSATSPNFYNYILSREKLLNTPTNFSHSNLFESFRPINSTEYKANQQSNEIFKDIKVNKMNFDDLKKYKTIFSKTNRNFFHIYNSVKRRNKSSNFLSDNFNTINYINNTDNVTNINDLLFSYQKQKKINDIIFTTNENSKGRNLYNFSLNSNIKSRFNRNKLLKNSLTEKKKTINYSKILYNFKNIKMFYAHLELLLSLYLKRNYKYFIEQTQKYEKIKIYENNINLYNTINNQNQPIINLNNAHCSLYYSININKDLNNNNVIFNNTNNNLKTFNINKHNVNNMQNINYILKPEENNSNKKKGNNNETVYVPKNKANKINKFKSNKTKNKNPHNIKNSSPIKEMSIDLKKMNLNTNKTFNNKLKNEKNKPKTTNSKNNIYKRPKDNNNIQKKIIKEIKIQNKEILLTPFQYKSKKSLENIKKENNTIKKIYIRKNNNIDNNNEMIKTSLFRNNSDLSQIKSFSNFLKKQPSQILIKKITTADKRIYININYMIYDAVGNGRNKNKLYIKLKKEQILSLTIIKNTLIILENINKNIIFSDIFIFDNDKSKFSINNKKEEKINKNLSMVNLAKTIKDKLIKSIRKYLLNRFERLFFLKKIINKKNNKILSYYFKRFYHFKNNNIIKTGIYHKINYNDDFNINKKTKTLINKKNNNIQFKIYPNNLYAKENNNIIYRNKNRKNKNKIQSSTNFSCNNKYWIKDINITVHEHKDNNKKKNLISSYNKK